MSNFTSLNTASPLAFILSLALIGAVSFTGCFGGGSSEPDYSSESGEVAPDRGDQTAPAQRQSLRGAVDQFSQAMGDVMSGDTRRAETVDFRELRELMPETLSGMERTDAGGERQSMGGFSVSQAKSQYNRDDSSLEVSIVDGGGAGSLVMLGAAWMMTSFDRESSSGFERTTRFDGRPAFEKQQEQNNRVRSELQFVVAERFFVSLKGDRMSVDDLRTAASGLNLRALEGMKDYGREG